MPAATRGRLGSHKRTLPAVLVLALLATACTLAADSPAYAPQQVEIAVRDEAFAYDGPIEPGRVVFHLHNEGDADHEVALVQLPDGMVDATDLIGSGRRGVAPVYMTATRAPGESAVFAVDLAEGRYALLGFGKDDDGTPFYDKGLVTTVTVGTPSGAGQEPTPDSVTP